MTARGSKGPHRVVFARNLRLKLCYRLHGMVKISDANNAGGERLEDCTLILTEGDFAKALAETGLSIVGRDNLRLPFGEIAQCARSDA